MTVSQQDKDEMAKILARLEGKSVPLDSVSHAAPENPVEILGPGQISQRDIDAMSKVLQSLNRISSDTVSEMITESRNNIELKEAIVTHKTSAGVKIGHYEILVLEDNKRASGKQYYRIINSETYSVIADDISLYETARTVVKHLNSGKFANNIEVRKLFEQDAAYSAHKIDAIRYKKLLKTAADSFKRDLYESRYEASVDRCMLAKNNIKKMSS